MSVTAVLAIAAGIILVGFAGRTLFEKTRVPDIPLLLGIGVVMGPWLHLVDRAALVPLAPYLGILALLMIMLEGGMNLDVDRVAHQMKWAFVLTCLAFALTMWSVAWAHSLLTRTPLPVSLLLGGLLACTSGAIVIPLVHAMRMAQNTRTILTLEAALGDALAVVSVIVMIQYLREPSADFLGHVFSVAKAFLLGVALGGLAGLLWVEFLARAGKMPLSYMLTVAAMFLLYSAVEALHSSGIIAVLLFGMALSNGPTLMKRLPFGGKEPDWDASRYALDHTIRWFHEEVTFIARVFFFVYLGMLLDFGQISLSFAGVSAAMIALVYLARFASVHTVGFLGRRQVPFERKILVSMAPRGLASAVLATVPAAAGIPGTSDFVQYAFAVILATNALITFSVIRSERRIDAMLAEGPPPGKNSGSFVA